jgi:hypothetical protein
LESDRLLDAWLPPTDSGPPVACIASTFTFEPGFFDEDCLSRFLALDSALVTGGDPADSRVYVLEREERLAEVTAAVLVDRGNAQAAASFRWDVIPINGGRGGVQHSKVALLAWERAMRLIVSSANLTNPGYRSNIEIFSVFDHDERSASLFREAIGFLQLLIRSRSEGSDKPQSPRARALTALGQLRTRVRKPAEPRRGAPTVHFLHTLDSRSLLEQAFEKVWKHSSPPRELRAVSPYFDQNAPIGVDALTAQLAQRGEVRAQLGVTAYTEGTGEDQVRVMAPEILRDRQGRASPDLRQWPADEETEADRFLHAKTYLFENHDRTMLIAGSANATGAGLGIGPVRNIEAVVAVSDRADTELARALYDAIPKFDAIPEGTRIFDAPVPEGSDQPPSLPIGFIEALYHPADDAVVISVSPSHLPDAWSIRSGEDEWFKQAGARTAKREGRKSLRRKLGGDPAPRSLAVSWQAKTSEWLAAEMVVAVADPGELADPPEIADLSLTELLDLLAIGGRLHDMLRRLVRRRLGDVEDSGFSEDPELDPHRKVETSGFILQRTRRMAQALEGLGIRLNQPISHQEALRRRLRGRLGPAGLAEAADGAVRAGEMSDRERAFLLAELALLVAKVRWRPVGRLTVNECRASSRSVLRALRPKATGDRSLDRYVREAFKAATK